MHMHARTTTNKRRCGRQVWHPRCKDIRRCSTVQWHTQQQPLALRACYERQIQEHCRCVEAKTYLGACFSYCAKPLVPFFSTIVILSHPFTIFTTSS